MRQPRLPKSNQRRVASSAPAAYSDGADLMEPTRNRIELFKIPWCKVHPELKSAPVEMPHDGFRQKTYAQKMIDGITNPQASLPRTCGAVV